MWCIFAVVWTRPLLRKNCVLFYRKGLTVILSYAFSCRRHSDAMNNRRRKTSLTKYIPLTLLQGFEKDYSRFACERELETEQNLQYFDPHSYSRHVVSFSFSWCSTGGPEAHSVGWWLPLLHLLWSPNFIGVPKGPLGRVWFYLTHIVLSSPTLLQLSWLLTWVSYIIVQRPLDRPLDLWNRMFNRHQADITVMQFTGHSLPVHLSMGVP